MGPPRAGSQGRQQARADVVWQKELAVFRTRRGLVKMRQLARDSASAAPQLGVAKGAALLQDVRAMAKRVVASEPPMDMYVLLGGSVRVIADKGLVSLYEKAGRSDDAARAHKLRDADTEWAKKASAEIKATAVSNPLRKRQKNHGITKAEVDAYMHGDPISDTTRRKLEAMTKEMDAIQRPLVQKWAEAMTE